MGDKHIKILLTGGGPGGSVTPICNSRSVAGLKATPEIIFLWHRYIEIGIEKGMVLKKKGIIFTRFLPVNLRRYFSWQNFTDPFRSTAVFNRCRLSINGNIIEYECRQFCATPVIFAVAYAACR